MPDSLHILLVEDNAGDARLLEEHLRDAPWLAATVDRVTRMDAVTARLERRLPDLVLLDLSLPDAQGMDTVMRALAVAPELPIVVLTGLEDEEVAIRAMHAGAQDYLVKGQVDPALLSRSIRYAIERKHLEVERQRLLSLSTETNERLILASMREQDLADEARAASEEKSRLLAAVSHEFRTPLSAIVGFSGLTAEGVAGPVTGRQLEFLGKIDAATTHLLALTDDLLDLAKVEAGQIRLDSRPASVIDVIGEASALVAPQAAAAEISLVTVAPAADCRYVGDHARVRQILLNLLSNAVKFTDRGGSVTVTAGQNATPGGEANASGVGPWAFIAVADTGIGIAPEEAEAVFLPFVRSQTSSARKRIGTGLGLTISRELARRMGGDLTLESIVGEGSCFTLWLPGGSAVDP